MTEAVCGPCLGAVYADEFGTWRHLATRQRACSVAVGTCNCGAPLQFVGTDGLVSARVYGVAGSWKCLDDC